MVIVQQTVASDTPFVDPIIVTEPFGSRSLSEIKLSREEIEHGSRFLPKFDSQGLLASVVVDSASGEVLVVAYMNQEAIDLTLSSGKVHFWSRSRERIWMKGETSGHSLVVEEVLIDCDQDAIVVKAKPAGPTCHTGARSCFYRNVVVDQDGAPVLVKVNT